MRYSKDVVYNNFPFPTATDSQRGTISSLAQAVLDARDSHPTDTLADLYDPNVMPANLAAAHRALDAYVDLLYRPEPFTSGAERGALLLGLRRALTRH